MLGLLCPLGREHFTLVAIVVLMLMLVAATPYWIHISDAPTRQSVLALTGAGGEPASQEVAGVELSFAPIDEVLAAARSESPHRRGGIVEKLPLLME
uniref:Uncharacterized protein n=1 Tax=Physcomitrium patens TaxID=3218 RepID=A0A2K1JYL7_PHYPA|nr:hypothetical protein PHYPA_013740 [Physcomitrium patens]